MAVPTAGNMIDNVLNSLDEEANSPAGAMGNGTDGTDVISTRAAILAHLSDAGAILARTCVPITDVANGTITTGNIMVALSGFTPVSSGGIWLPRAVVAGGVVLENMSRDVMEVYNMGLASSPAGVPKYWFWDGEQIGFDVPVLANTAVVVQGYALPVPFTAEGNTWAWLQAPGHLALEWYAEYRIARKNLSDGHLGPKAMSAALNFDEYRLQLWQSLQTPTRRYAYPVPPRPIAGAPAPQQGG